MKGYELLNFMLRDADLRNIVTESPSFNRDYIARRTSKRSLEDSILSHFWRSVDGAIFRSTLENKLGETLATRLLRGREARIKDAMLLFIAELKREGSK